MNNNRERNPRVVLAELFREELIPNPDELADLVIARLGARGFVVWHREALIEATMVSTMLPTLRGVEIWLTRLGFTLVDGVWRNSAGDVARVHPILDRSGGVIGYRVEIR